jgi:DNA processing protein
MQPLSSDERQRRILLATEPDLPSASLCRLLDPDAGSRLPWNAKGLEQAGVPLASRRRLLLGDRPPSERVDALVEQWRRSGVSFAVRGEADYPERLQRCSDAPSVLFWRGREPNDPDLRKQPHLAVVGTRRASAYGVEGTRRVLGALRAHRICVVSGGAYGIDATAHRAALEAGLPTFAVLAGGVDRPYPSGHVALFEAILEAGGCLLSECPPGNEALKHRFPRRNRLIAGLADAVLVMESGAKGGSLITADQAFSYHREVLAYPGPVGRPQQAGTHALIRREMARLVTSGRDIARIMAWPMIEGNALDGQEEAACPERWRPLQQVLLRQGSMDPEALAKTLKLDPACARHQLLEAELEGWVVVEPGGSYRWR